MKHMSKLPYLEACLRETLRLHPTAPAFSLAAKGDQVLGERYEVKDKQTVVVFLNGFHRDKSVYGEDAEKFKPERMMGENFKNLPPNSWKVCIYSMTASKFSVLTRCSPSETVSGPALAVLSHGKKPSLPLRRCSKTFSSPKRTRRISSISRRPSQSSLKTST